MKHIFSQTCKRHRLYRRGFEAIELLKHIQKDNVEYLILRHNEEIVTDTVNIIENLRLQIRKREFTFSLYIFEKGKAMPTQDLEVVTSNKLKKEIAFFVKTQVVNVLEEAIKRHKHKYDPNERKKRHIEEAKELGLSDEVYKLKKIQESMRLKKEAERRRKERKELSKESELAQEFYRARDNHVNYNHLAQDLREWEQMPSQHEPWEPDKMKYITQYLNFRTYFKFESYVCGAVEIYTSSTHTIDDIESCSELVAGSNITLLSPGKIVFEKFQCMKQD